MEVTYLELWLIVLALMCLMLASLCWCFCCGTCGKEYTSCSSFCWERRSIGKSQWSQWVKKSYATWVSAYQLDLLAGITSKSRRTNTLLTNISLDRNDDAFYWRSSGLLTLTVFPVSAASRAATIKARWWNPSSSCTPSLPSPRSTL